VNATRRRIRRLLPVLILAGLASHASTVSAGVGVWTSLGPAGGDIRALVISSSRPATLFAGTSNGGVFRSTNGGGSWTAVNTGMTSTAVQALAIDPASPTTLFAGTSGGGVFKSIDGGENWTAVNTDLTSTDVRALAIGPGNPGMVYAGTSGAGVFRSANGGGSWTAMNTGLASTDVRALAINQWSQSNPAMLYAGTSGGVFRNDGVSWTAINAGLTDTNVQALAIDPGGYWDYGGETPYAGTPGGAFRSDGASWTAINIGLTNTVVRALAIPYPPSGAAPDTAYAGTEGGVFKIATNGGGSWTAINAGLPSIAVRVLAIDPTDPATLYAGTSGAGVFRRTNSTTGATWLLPSSAHSNGAGGAFYTTNLAVANVGAAPASFTMKFLGHDQDGSGGPEQTFNLEAGRSVTYFDVLGTIFNQTSNFGAIRITSDRPSLNLVSVTSTPGFGGTLGQTIPAVFSSNLIPTLSSRSILYIREGDGFRSNLVLASNTGVSTTVLAVLVSPEGTTLAAKSYTVPPNGMTQINRVVRDMGVPGAVTGARLVLSSSTPEAAFTAFASVIDEVTNDPTAVAAR
jgi:photosystem II stability/assembly factor-like uncharacterized protein